MSFNSNNVYISPITNQPVNANVCNYNPTFPCGITKPYISIALGYPAYNVEEYNPTINQKINYANAVAQQAEAVLTSDDTAIIFTAQQIANIQENVDKTFE